ncbi:hypothetical protein M0811_13608 [Anaeramoeba ignava]|uniref:Uncharacterized protein n=1 Tax=Anaeramoeba ignava TaxID=1746090 RepID=A0A9Q0L7W6_ANAIG|nr:hypothetical protein M0811_13608 [Anaeramoeba ignava]
MWEDDFNECWIISLRLNKPFRRMIDSSFEFNLKRIEDYIKFHNIKDNFDELEKKMNEVFQTFIETENILIIINNFQFKDKIILNTSFLDESKMKQN